MAKRKLLVTPWSVKSKADKEASLKGKEILQASKKNTMLVKYYGKKWCLIKLLQFLASKVYDLERNQCKPNTKCLFKAQKHLDEKYIGKKHATSKFYYYE